MREARTTFTRRALLGTLAGGVAAGAGLAAHAADNWPARMVRLISPYGAGGANDISLRILAEQFGRSFGQQFIVENSAGAGTRLANESVAHAQRDGNTFLYAAAPYATAEALFGKLNYERSDLQPVAMTAFAPIFLIINAQAQLQDAGRIDRLRQVAARRADLRLARRRLAAASGRRTVVPGAGVNGLNIPFRGDAHGLHRTAGRPRRCHAHRDLLGAAVRPERQVPRARRRLRRAQRDLPAGPTLREQGYPNVVAAGWYGFMAPAATPRPIVDRFEKEIMRALTDEEVKQKLLAQGLEPHGTSAAEFGKFIVGETAKWGALIREAGLKGE